MLELVTDQGKAVVESNRCKGITGRSLDGVPTLLNSPLEARATTEERS